jgi:hypothetical protein
MTDQTTETNITLESPPEASETPTGTSETTLDKSNQGEANDTTQEPVEGSKEGGKEEEKTTDSPFDHQSFNDDLANSADGKFSQEKREEALEIGKKVGIPESVITAYMDNCERDLASAKQAGEQQQVDAQELQAYANEQEAKRDKVLGDADATKQIISWARENLTQEDLNYYQDALNYSDTAVRAATALKALYESNTGVKTGEPKLFTGSTNAGGFEGFSSKEAYFEALSKKDDKGNRLYETSPDYKAEVRKRLNLSKDKW